MKKVWRDRGGGASAPLKNHKLLYEFDTSRTPYTFVEIDHEIISTRSFSSFLWLSVKSENMCTEYSGKLAQEISVVNNTLLFNFGFFIIPPPLVMGGHIASPLSVRTSRTSCPVRTKNGFWAISFEYIGVLDSYFIHRYIIIKYRSSSITEKIHWFLSELWPLISVWKMVSGQYLLKTVMYWIYISYTGI